MVGGRLRCLSYFFTHSAVLLLGVCLHDVEASNCRHIIVHKEVGDTVELSSCLPTEGATSATWKYGITISTIDITIADKDGSEAEDTQFKGRVDLNPTTFSLTVRELTRQDSGYFSFVSDVNGKQRETVTITLKVHEPITEPVLSCVNSTWDASNNSCTVLLECTTTSNGVTYKWAVRNHTQTGSRLQYYIRPDDGETDFTCTISNFVRERSASRSEKCSNDTSGPPPTGPVDSVLLLSAAAAGGCLIVLIIACIICVWCLKQKQAESTPGSDCNDLTIYADISEAVTEDRKSTTLKSCSLYETIDNRVNRVPQGPETVYDKIQLDRITMT